MGFIEQRIYMTKQLFQTKFCLFSGHVCNMKQYVNEAFKVNSLKKNNLFDFSDPKKYKNGRKHFF